MNYFHLGPCVILRDPYTDLRMNETLRLLTLAYHKGSITLHHEEMMEIDPEAIHGLVSLKLIPCEDGEDPTYTARLSSEGRSWVESNAPRGYRYTLTPDMDGVSVQDLGFVSMEEAKAKAQEIQSTLRTIPMFAGLTMRLSRRMEVR